MKSRKTVILLGSALVAACGGSGGDVAGIDAGGGFPPVATSVVSQGTITGFGSIIVNGVRYDTASTSFTIEDEPGAESDLAVGQVVLVQGTINADGETGVAQRVIYDDLIEGPIQSLDTVAGTLVVLGQTVVTNGDTSYENEINPRSLDGLAVDDVIEVSGFRNANGEVIATRIELEDGAGNFETTGFVQNLDSVALTFDIGGLVVDYSSAMLEDFPMGMLENGQLVEAEGSTIGASGELIATVVEFEEDDFDIEDGDDVEIEGLVTRFVSATDFDVNGITVTTTGSTEYENGTSTDLALDRKIEVEGSFNASGILVAEEIEFEQEGGIRVAGLVEDVQATTLTVLGLQFSVDSGTEFEDDSPAELQRFSLSDVSVGNYVELRGYESTAGLVATRVERTEISSEVLLIGEVDSVNDPEIVILGITVVTDAGTEFEEAELPVSRADFFGAALGRVVEVEGRIENGVLLAEEVELDD